MHKLFASLALSVGLVIATPVLAAPMTYTVPSSALTNGGTISGTFVYDGAAVAGSRLISINLVETGPGAGTFTFNGVEIGTALFFGQRTAVATVNVTRAVYVDTALMPPGGGTYTANIFTGTCISVSGGKCNDISGVSSASGVVVTAAPLTAAVPTMSEWAMILFGTILAGGAALYIQSRRLTA